MGKEKDKIQIDINKNTCRVCLSNNATNNIYGSKIFYNKMKVYCFEMMDDMLSMPVCCSYFPLEYDGLRGRRVRCSALDLSIAGLNPGASK